MRRNEKNALCLLAACSALLMSPAMRGETGKNVFALDMMKHQPSEKPAQLKAADKGVVEWRLPDGRGQSITLDLAKLGCDPKQYDEIRFDLKPMLGPVRQRMKLYGRLGIGKYTQW